jgi:repressor of nif and glnA expression
MTSVTSVARSGYGKILVNYREGPGPCVSLAREIVEALRGIGIGGVLALGQPSEPVCGIPVGLNRAGMALLGGMNPIAAVEEMGIQTHNQAMVTMMEFQDLVSFWDL